MTPPSRNAAGASPGAWDGPSPSPFTIRVVLPGTRRWAIAAAAVVVGEIVLGVLAYEAPVAGPDLLRLLATLLAATFMALLVVRRRDARRARGLARRIEVDELGFRVRTFDGARSTVRWGDPGGLVGAQLRGAEGRIVWGTPPAPRTAPTTADEARRFVAMARAHGMVPCEVADPAAVLRDLDIRLRSGAAPEPAGWVAPPGFPDASR